MDMSKVLKEEVLHERECRAMTRNKTKMKLLIKLLALVHCKNNDSLNHYNLA